MSTVERLVITEVFGSTESVGDDHFVRYSRKSITLHFFNAKFQFGDCRNVRYSRKSVISESGTVDSAYNIHEYKGQPVIAATNIRSQNSH